MIKTGKGLLTPASLLNSYQNSGRPTLMNAVVPLYPRETTIYRKGTDKYTKKTQNCGWEQLLNGEIWNEKILKRQFNKWQNNVVFLKHKNVPERIPDLEAIIWK